LGYTIQIERVREHFLQAKQDLAEEVLFEQIRSNMWLKQQMKRMPLEIWEKLAHPVYAQKLKGRICFGGNRKHYPLPGRLFRHGTNFDFDYEVYTKICALKQAICMSKTTSVFVRIEPEIRE
jgi:hypothetical protein